MTITRLISLVKELTPSPFSDSVLLMWLSNCENSILTDVFLVRPEETEEYTEASEAALLVPHPYDKLYLPYMQAQIAHANEEYDLYANLIALYEAYRDEYAQYIIQNTDPARGVAVYKGYYLSAYGIAKAHGYTGTEQEWLESLKGPAGDDGKDAEQLPPEIHLIRKPGGILVLRAEGLEPEQEVTLHLYTVSRRGGKQWNGWKHPANYDALDGGNVAKMGYGLIAGTEMVGEVLIDYPEVPEWMPNGGFLQTEIVAEADSEGKLAYTLYARRWLCPMLKPDKEQLWANCHMMGINAMRRAPILMQWRIVDAEGKVGICREMLAVGAMVRNNAQLTYDAESGEAKGLYISIRD